MEGNAPEDWEQHYGGYGVNSPAPDNWLFILSRLDWREKIARSEKPRMKILDIGCGLTVCLRLVKLLFPWHYNYYGVDRSENAIKQIHKFFPILDAPENFTATSVPPLKYGDDFFDVIIMTSSLEHIVDVKTLLAEVRRIAKNKCKIFISVPDNCCGGTLWETGEPDILGTHVWRWNEELMRKLLEENGFNILEVKHLMRSSLSLVTYAEVLK